jgi:hypothetical protein
MSYFLRVLGKKNPDIHLDDLYSELKKRNLKANLEITEDKKPESWDLLKVTRGRGLMLTQIERNIKGEPLFEDELEEFRNEIAGCEPKTAIPWLQSFFDQTKVIYAFEILKDAQKDNNFDVIDAVIDVIMAKTGGISQADGEGFSNDEGDHILWQFDDEEIEGEWNCAVMDNKGKWQKFSMELSDPKHQKAFKSGKTI